MQLSERSLTVCYQMAPILRLKQAIDAIENDDHTVMDPAVAYHVRTAWATIRRPT